MKYLVVFFVVAATFLSAPEIDAQILTFDHGEVEFYTASAISDIEAITDEVDVQLNTETGDVAVKIDIKSFEFNYDLMKEHFNEKYMESDEFPQAMFFGKIQADIAETNGEDVDVAGELTIHGVTKKIQLKANISNQGEHKVVKFSIPVVFKDYNVDDPSILTKSVAKDVEIEGVLFLK